MNDIFCYLREKMLILPKKLFYFYVQIDTVDMFIIWQ